MNLPIEEKLEFVGEILKKFCEKFDVVNLREHARNVKTDKVRSLNYGKVQTA
jgi:hypothetical protein